ncbi:dGTP triphosphohydrolase [Melittangium boletus]|uniref:dGTP triphosphohydrolase n=1 Tax=Melittangium boletus TaxID=83453 RepID=UPI003DA23E9B
MMDWKNLLCPQRIRELHGGRASARDEQELRTEFDRDYDRAVFSTPVRRLQDKTQVFPLEPHDAVRTRLTHSMEVSTLARGLARAVTRGLVSTQRIDPDQASGIEVIAATCGLIHDVGNPPFGHAGEKAISSWFKNRVERDPGFFGEFDAHPLRDQLRQDFLCFEGNAQTLRIVSKLQLLADRHGLNLTVGTLSAAMKYTAASHQTGKTGKAVSEHKPGYFASEQGVVDKIRKATGTQTARNPIASLVEASDDTIYATVDLEDGVKKGVITWSELEQAIPDEAPSSARDFIREQLKAASDYISSHIEHEPELALKGRALDEAKAQHFRTVVIAKTKGAVLQSFDSHYDALMNGSYRGELIADSTANALIQACKEVGRKHVYSSAQTLRLELLGRRVIHDLMDLFWEGVALHDGVTPGPGFAGKIYNLLSRNYRAVFEQACKQSPLPRSYHRFQLVTDYVCGMTDTFACKLHSELTHG